MAFENKLKVKRVYLRIIYLLVNNMGMVYYSLCLAYSRTLNEGLPQSRQSTSIRCQLFYSSRGSIVLQGKLRTPEHGLQSITS